MATRKPLGLTGFVIKSENQDGTVTWAHPETLEEITLNAGTVPTRELLGALAANGIAPALPMLDDRNAASATQHGVDSETDDESEPETALSRVLARMKNGGENGESRAEVKIYRLKSDGSESYCMKCTPEEYDNQGDEMIRAAFGAGKYRVRVYGPQIKPGTQYGKFVRLCTELVEIEQSAAPIKSALMADTMNAAPSGVVDLLLKRLDQLEQNRNSTPDVDFMATMERMAKLQQMLGGNKKEKSLLEQIQEMKALQEFQSDMRGDSGGEQNELLGLASKVIGALQPALAQQAQPQDTSLPTVELPPSFQTTPELENAQVNTAENFMLNITIGALIHAAVRNDDVNIHAPALYEKLPDEILDSLEMPMWHDVLCELLPQRRADLIQHRAWFDSLRLKIIQIDKEDASGDAGVPA
jgi:hypothetical protein